MDEIQSKCDEGSFKMQKVTEFNRKGKRVLAFLLTLLMILTTFPQNIYAVKVRENEEYNAGLTLRPISRTFHLDRIMEWKKGGSPDDLLNQASVPLRERFTGHVVNPKANPKAKIQSVPLMNPKNDIDNSVNGNEFDSFAFDFWQYVDQMVFWDGPVPTADVIDAGHRNGVPVYGTLFFNWSDSNTIIADQEVLKKFLTKKMVDGQETYPNAEKLVEIAEYYGFDGYFINQETPLYAFGETMRDFMLYAKRYAKKVGSKIRFSWYDAMTNQGNRFHYNEVNEYNDYFVRKYGDDEVYASDEFFMNFGWGHITVGTSAAFMEKIGRDPYDAYAGFELQQNSIKTRINWDGLVDEKGKLKVSIGLYTPDSIKGFAKDAEDYHEQERNFWVGYDGDPVTSDDTNSKNEEWRGMARYVADKSVIMSLPFNTYFNTGHGKQWFINGELSKDEEWNSRGVQEILPTWRWWIRKNGQSEGALKAKYDFTDAYNSGNSVKFYGQVEEGAENKIMLYSTRLAIVDGTKLKVAYKGGKASDAFVELGTAENYDDNAFQSFALPKAEEEKWATAELDVSGLAGQTVHSIRLKLVGTAADENYSFNLGQIALYADATAPEKVQDLAVDESMFRTSKHAEARLSWVPADDVEYYEVYQETKDGKMSIINATSSKYFYAEDIRRDFSRNNNTQKLYVVSVGKNGVKSEPAEVSLEWNMDLEDTEDLVKEGRNLCLDATVTGFSHENKTEPARNAINGTISGNSDKWCASGNSGWMSIAFPEARTVKSIVLYHAGSGGEAGEGNINNMNTIDFSILYKEDGEWKVAKKVTGNTKNVTEYELEDAIIAKEWKLDIQRADSSPWKAVRIYEWQMFEQPRNKRSSHIPMRWVRAENTSGDLYDITVKNVAKDTEVKLYRDVELKNLIESKVSTGEAFNEVHFSNITLEIPEGQKYGKFYYVTKDPQMEQDSIRMTALYQKERKLSRVELTKVPEKKVYAYGADLKVADGQIKLVYADGGEETVNLTPKMIRGFDSESEGEQTLTVFYNGMEADKSFVVTVKAKDYIMPIIEIKVKDRPKTAYLIGEEINLENGSLEVIYEDLTKKTVSMKDSEVSYSGFDSMTEGTKEVVFSYQGKSVTLEMVVNQKEVVNKEKLEEVIRQVEMLMEEEYYKKADENEKEKLAAVLSEAMRVYEESEDKEEVAEVVSKLLIAEQNFLKVTIKEVKIQTEPSKKEYQFGEKLNVEDGVLLVTFADGQQSEVAMTEAEHDFNAEKVGEQEVTITYKNHEAGKLIIVVAAQESESLKALKAEIKRAKEVQMSEAYQNAPAAAREALDNIIRVAEMLVEANGSDEDAERVTAEIRGAIADLTRPSAPLLPYIPEEKKDEETTIAQPSKPKEETIEEEKLALSSAEKALAEEITKNMTVKEDRELVEKLIAKKVSANVFVKLISNKALEEYASTVAETFKDEKADNWYAKELSALRLVNMVQGYEDKTFRAMNQVTGQQLIALLVRLGGLQTEQVKEGENWFVPYKKAAEEAGILKGIEFDLTKALSREEVAILVYNLMLLSQEKTEVKAQEIKDVDKVNPKFVNAVHFLFENEIVKGYEDGTFRPEANVKRAEVMVIMYRILQK